MYIFFYIFLFDNAIANWYMKIIYAVVFKLTGNFNSVYLYTHF